MRIGFIGLGNMGQHMAARLLAAGHDVVLFDTNAAAVDRAVGQGGEAAVSAAALGATVEIVFLSLPTPDVVDRVTTDLTAGGVRIVVDLSTTGPEAAARIGATLKGKGIALVDAPVSGGITGAEAGTLAIMVSGDQAAIAEVEPALLILGKIFNLGVEAGQAQAMKVINNMLCAAGAVAAFEGLVLGAKLGLDSKAMLDVINASSGRSFATEVKIPQCVLDRSFPMRFATSLLDKDVRLCLEEGVRQNVPMPVATATREFLARGVEAGFGQVDYGRLITMIEAPAGAQFGYSEEDKA